MLKNNGFTLAVIDAPATNNYLRTHGCADQACNVKKVLANSEPSTHGTKRRFWNVLSTVAFGVEADITKIALARPCRCEIPPRPVKRMDAYSCAAATAVQFLFADGTPHSREDPRDAYCGFFTNGHLDSDSGWNAWSAGIVATNL